MQKYRYLTSALLLSIVALLILFVCTLDSRAVYLATVLALLEISLSFDNALINARILEKMDPVWQHRFLWLGLPLAVFGMRLVFPILLVYWTGSMSLTAVIHSVLYSPDDYAHALHASYPTLSAFGASFLAMVFFHFILGQHAVHWIKIIENNRFIRFCARYRWSAATFTLILGLAWWLCHELSNFWSPFILGIVVYEVIHSASALCLKQQTPLKSAKLGFMGFLYLEVLDASFSFDGVISAFAISSHVLIIVVGLGIGALFVRSFTLHFVEHRTLKKIAYLEHSAYYAVGSLALIMLISNEYNISELVSGGVGLSWIIAGMVTSMIAAKKKAR